MRATTIDTRTEPAPRAGELPGAVVIDRTVLEWRLDPASESRIPEATGYDLHVVVVCRQGYSSNLAAAVTAHGRTIGSDERVRTGTARMRMNRWGKRADMLVHEDDPYNAEPPPGALAGEVLTSADAFYSRNHGPIPELDPATWRLRVGGLVENPVSLSLEDLRARFKEHSLIATMQCAGNQRSGFLAVRDVPGEDPWRSGATSTARWAGVRLADVLSAAGIDSSAAHVAFEAPDVSQLADPPQPYGGSIPVAKALADETLLAWAMNGEALAAVHGAPVRVVVPGWIGARSVKWVQRITAEAQPSGNYFQATAYRLLPSDADPAQAGPGDGLSLGAIALNSAILQPADGDRVTAGPLEIVGYAFAGENRSVVRVDVSLDGGTSWVQAELVAQPGEWAWCQWRARVEIQPGDVAIAARAWDSTAALQPASAADLWNPKGYVNNSWPRIHIHAEPPPDRDPAGRD